MRKQLFLLSSLSLVLSACENHNAPAPNADNTAQNVHDQNQQTLTPRNQSEGDLKLTQKIRQALMDDESLSTNGKNVKIITSNGVVTLRGAVNSEREKNEIGKKAKSIFGVRNVDNQLEIIRSDQANSP